MQISDIPGLISTPFADSGDKNTIPVTPSGVPGAANYQQGFPPITRLAKGAGGIPPSGQDFNGLFYAITEWTRWQGAGAPAVYNSAFSTAVGGYPKGATVASASVAGLTYVSTVDNNTTDPDAAGAGWSVLTQNNLTTITTSTTLSRIVAGTLMVSCSAGSVTLTLPLSASSGGLPMSFRIVRTDGTANTLTVSAPGGNTIEGAATYVVSVGQRITLTGDGTAGWWVTGQSAPASGTGWVRLNTGQLMQWGTGTTATGGLSVTFPVSFSAAPPIVQITEAAAGSWTTTNLSVYGCNSKIAGSMFVSSLSWNGTGFVPTVGTFQWLAIGF